MTREETVKNLLTELIDMIDNGSQRDLDRADEIGASIIKLLEQEPVLDKIRAEIEHMTITEGGDDYVRKMAELFSFKMKVLQIIDKYKAESEE